MPYVGRGLSQAAELDRQIISLARGASDEWDTTVALPLTAVSSQNVIGSFEARFFLRKGNRSRQLAVRVP
jgi:hypothetical protein